MPARRRHRLLQTLVRCADTWPWRGRHTLRYPPALCANRPPARHFAQARLPALRGTAQQPRLLAAKTHCPPQTARSARRCRPLRPMCARNFARRAATPRSHRPTSHRRPHHHDAPSVRVLPTHLRQSPVTVCHRPVQSGQNRKNHVRWQGHTNPESGCAAS